MAFNKTNIDWPGLGYTWNPVTGCKRGCSYCYARRIHERFNKTPFSEIIFHPSRLYDDKQLKEPSTIFVGSMSDIDYWPADVTIKIIEACAKMHKHTFMFLSKNPMSYWDYSWPPNTMQGLTMELTQTQHCQEENIEQMCRYPRPFLSFEPLLGYLQTPIPDKIELVIVGAMTGPGAKKPLPEWINNINVFVQSNKIHWKKNIREYL